MVDLGRDGDEPTDAAWERTAPPPAVAVTLRSDPSRPLTLGKPVPVDRCVNSIRSLAFSPDGRVLAVGGHTGNNGDAGSGGFADPWSLTSPSHPVLLGRLKSPATQGWDA
ncbi:hypothetical protein [Streptomyces naphthomycinicus]|uniref:hypothetical protein n=1 Tax=Streptomyces naphthomycinicus TaxID=2872625 RepID=UPI00288BA90B|nr:hypothetical protein [Streptomyces sp. TML10]